MNKHELSLLALLLLNESLFYERRHVLSSKLFKSDLNAKAFNEIERLRVEGKDVNEFTYKAELPLSEIYSADLSIDIEWLISTLRHAYVSDSITKIFSKASAELSTSEDTDGIIDGLKCELQELISGSTSLVNPISHNIFNLIEYINSPNISGFNTGIRELDGLGGFQKSDLVIVAGRTSQGKTSFALNIMLNLGLKKTKAAIISLEMSSLQLTTRIVSMHKGISAKNLITKQLTDHDRFEIKNLSDLIDAPLYIDDSPLSTLSYISSRVRTFALQYKCEMIFIDYLQLITNTVKGQSREQEVGNIARALKNLAKELNICIVALSQLSRSKDVSQEPRLSELRDSGQIEEAADVIMLIYRPESYGILNFEDGQSTHGVAEITIAKGRNIGTGQFRMGFNNEQTKFI